ncbi:MAG: hypothetical protein QW478_12610 [Candidatus Micrarchaeaceae archaeon]
MGFIIDADSKEDAIIDVENLLEEDFVGEGREYDFYNLFNKENAVERWGKLPSAMLVTSDAGKKFIQEQMKTTKDAIKEAINGLKENVNNVDLNDYHKISELSYWSNKLGSTNCIYLFDVINNDSIFTDKQLDDVLNKELEPGKKRFVVPVDLHF